MTLNDAQSVYDFEGWFEPAIAAIFQIAGITCATPETITKLQSSRPRIEIMMRTGAALPRGTQGQRVIVDTLGNVRDAAYRGEINVDVITNAGEMDKVTHSQLRAFVRAQMMTMPRSLNGVPALNPPDLPPVSGLVNHSLNFITHSGDAWTIKNTDGYWQTRMSFAIEFSIQATALQQLAA